MGCALHARLRAFGAAFDDPEQNPAAGMEALVDPDPHPDHNPHLNPHPHPKPNPSPNPDPDQALVDALFMELLSIVRPAPYMRTLELRRSQGFALAAYGA